MMPRYALLLLFLATAAPLAHAQEQARAEQRLQELRAQIALYEDQLTDTRMEEASATEVLSRVDGEIAVREALIESYSRRLTELNVEAAAIEDALAAGEIELGQLRQEYAQYARHAYARGRVGDLALILSAGSVNLMLVRARYLQRFSRQRERKAEQILSTHHALAGRRAELDSTAARIQSLLAESRSEQYHLASRKRERAQIVENLRQRRSSLQAEVRRRQQEAEGLRSRIHQLIAEADAERRRAAEEEERRAAAAAASRAGAAPGGAEAVPPLAARTATPAPAAEVSVAEFARLSGSFRQNRGRLPWPVRGVVTEPFGQRRNEVTGTVIHNPGLVIATTPGIPVQAIFGGAVSRIFAIPGYGTCILVTHGDFQTVYGNLSAVEVQQGARLEPGAVIGRAGTQAQPLGPGIFFGVFQDGREVDPGVWLARP
jgi:murein hydrolase activator